jgi:hypothetical protein
VQAAAAMDVAARLVWGWTPGLHAPDMFGKVGEGRQGLGAGGGQGGAICRRWRTPPEACCGRSAGRGAAWDRTADAPATPPPRRQVVVVTGASSGLGYEAALRLAERRATVVMGVRSLEAGRR